MAAEADTVSHKSPFYAELNDKVTRELQLPPGLLSAIVTRGERSNSDQISDAGAKTVYQIIPETRDAALKKWGIDAYLSPENAAQVAGRVLQDSLKRNNNVAPLAVAEYIGGTDPKNWGPQTTAYVRRVTGEPLVTTGPNPKQSTFDRVMAKRTEDATPQLARVYAAYTSGQMTPEDSAAFESDVAAGRVVLPRGAKVAAAPAAGGIPEVPAGVIDAYTSGGMSPEDKHDFETDVADGRVKVPAGVEVAKPAGMLSRAADATFEAISGAARSTPEIEKLPDWSTMPEFTGGSLSALKTGLGTLLAAPAEAVKIIQANNPEVKARQDSKGNYILTSRDGNEYAIKPGMRPSDAPRIVSAAGAFTPAGAVKTIGGAALAAGGTEAAIQATQAATGGDFDAKDVLIAAAGGAAVPAVGRVIEAAKPAVARGVDAVRSRLPGVAARAEPPAGGVPPVEPVPSQPGPAAGTIVPEVPPAAAAPRPAEVPPAAEAPPAAAADTIPNGETYAPAKFSVSGLAVRDETPNLSSIKSSLTDYKVLPGVREVPFSDFKEMGPLRYHSVSEEARVKALAREIAYNGEINPLIVVMDEKGPYILEGGHRFDALRELKKESFPAVVVQDLESIPAAVPRPAEAPPAAAAVPHEPPYVPPGVEPPAAAPSAVAPQMPSAAVAPTQTAEELAQVARKAAGGGFGSKAATKELAESATPDAETLAAAKRLGIEEHLQPDHVTTNDAYRTLAAVVKSIPASEAKAAEVQGLAKVAERADGIITELGGSRDLSALNAGVKTELTRIEKDFKTQAGEMFDAVRDRINPRTPAPANNVLQAIKTRADELGGEQYLSAGERKILADLAPKDGKPPTYALLDQTRKDIGEAAYGRNEAFGTRDSRLLKNLTRALGEDQAAVAKAAGADELLQAANAATKMYKGVQDDLTGLFGKTLSDSIVGDLSRSVKALAAGDVSGFVRLIKATPESMRHEVVASGLASAFNNSAQKGGINFSNYANWFEGLQRNRIARDALFSNLPKPAVQRLTDLYKVSKGIAASTGQFIATGRLLAAPVKQILEADNLLSHVFDVAKKAGAAEVLTSSMGLPGAGMAAAVGAALTKGRTPVMKAADSLINSPEFIAAARNASKNNINRLARSSKFARFVKAAGNPREMKNGELWVAQALQAKRESGK